MYRLQVKRRQPDEEETRSHIAGYAFSDPNYPQSDIKDR